MIEPKRATWGEFVEWVAQKRIAYCPGPVYGLSVAASYVESRREAAAALLGLGVRPDVVDKLCGEWIELRIEPPADPPSVTEVLENVAVELKREAESCANAAADRRSHGYDDAEDYDAAEDAYEHAARILRSKAKEFV